MYMHNVDLMTFIVSPQRSRLVLQICSKRAMRAAAAKVAVINNDDDDDDHI